MAARDGEFRNGVYYFKCEACGRPTTAKRGHARACSAACGARLRRQLQPGKAAESEGSDAPLNFYVSLSKLRRQLAELAEMDTSSSAQIEMVVGVERPGRRTELAKLEIERVDGGEGGLLCRVGAPYSPFRAGSTEAVEAAAQESV